MVGEEKFRAMASLHCPNLNATKKKPRCLPLLSYSCQSPICFNTAKEFCPRSILQAPSIPPFGFRPRVFRQQLHGRHDIPWWRKWLNTRVHNPQTRDVSQYLSLGVHDGSLLLIARFPHLGGGRGVIEGNSDVLHELEDRSVVCQWRTRRSRRVAYSVGQLHASLVACNSQTFVGVSEELIRVYYGIVDCRGRGDGDGTTRGGCDQCEQGEAGVFTWVGDAED